MKTENAEEPLVAVVIPAYNREKCVGEAIESVLAQKTDFPYEIIVVDDGSTDRTAEVARSYGHPVRVICKPNGGPGSARNAGVLAARAPLIAFLDSDDLILPGRLARQAEYLQAHPEVILTLGDLVLDASPGESYLKSHNLPFESGQWFTVDEPYRRLLTETNFVPNPTTMLRKEHYVKAGMMDESLRGPEDWDLWSRMALRGKFAYCCVPFARQRRSLGDNLMSSSYILTDMAAALHGMLFRDRILTQHEKEKSLAWYRKLLRQRLRYDLLERGRRQMLRDLREMGGWFGPWYFLKWWAISLLPRRVARFVSRLRARGRMPTSM